MKKSRKLLWELINHFEVYLGTVLFIGMMILLTLQVITRYFLKHSFTWTEEVATLMFIWMVYLGSSAAVLEGKHLRIDLFLSMMRGRLKKAALLFTNLVTMVFCGYIIFPLTNIIMTLQKRNSVTPLVRFPNWVAYLIIPVCMAVMFIRLIQDSIRILKTEDIDGANETETRSIFDAYEGEGAEGSDKV